MCKLRKDATGTGAPSIADWGGQRRCCHAKTHGPAAADRRVTHAKRNCGLLFPR